MSSSSDSSGPSSEGEARSPAALAKRVLRKLQHAPLHQSMAVADHQKATEAMTRLRDALLAVDGGGANRQAASFLTCAGIAVHRRILIGPEQLDAADSLMTTMALLFVLVVLATGGTAATGGIDEATGGQHEGGTGANEDDATVSLAEYEAGTLWTSLCAADADTTTSSWARVLRDPGGLCQSLLQLTRRGGNALTLGQLANYGGLFFRSSASAMATGLLDNAAPVVDGNDFLTLDAMAIARETGYLREERLQGIADCAESEAGQTVLRDLILSFKLPRVVVGVRRTCLLSRESNRLATEQHSEILGGAHDAAMRGARWSWEKDPDRVHKMCALLSGLAVQMCANAQSVRKDDMFNGRVQLPFLETYPVEPGVTRLALLEHSHEWVVYSMSAKGQPTVKLRQQGYEGMIAAALQFVSSI